jgi:hypothetical protein
MFKIAPGDFVSPDRRSAASVLRQSLGYWCNLQVYRYDTAILNPSR